MILFQFQIVLLFNPAEPETAAIENPDGLKMMKLVFLVLILSFLEVFAQDPEILIDYDHMRTYPCYNRCVTKLDECKKYYDCSGRRESERQWCFLFCTNEHNSCIDTECKV